MFIILKWSEHSAYRSQLNLSMCANNSNDKKKKKRKEKKHEILNNSWKKNYQKTQEKQEKTCSFWCGKYLSWIKLFHLSLQYIKKRGNIIIDHVTAFPSIIRAIICMSWYQILEKKLFQVLWFKQYGFNDHMKANFYLYLNVNQGPPTHNNQSFKVWFKENFASYTSIPTL